LPTVFVSPDEHGKAKLILLDHGLYDYLNDRDRVSLCQLYKAIILHDDELMKQQSLQLGVHGKTTHVTSSLFFIRPVWGRGTPLSLFSLVCSFSALTLLVGSFDS